MVLLAALTLALLGCGGLGEAEKRVNAGAELYEQGHLEEAIAEYGEAIRLDSEDANAYNNRGNAYRHLGQYQGAIQDLDEAIRLNPEDALAYGNRGAAYNDLGQYRRALPRLL